MSNAVTAVPSVQRLQEIEAQIQEEMKFFIRIGRLLKAVQEEELYKAAGFKNLHEYTAKRWNIDKSHTYRLISAYCLCQRLAERGHELLPDNESVSRALLTLKDDDVAERVWAEATLIEDVPTKKTVLEIIKRVTPEDMDAPVDPPAKAAKPQSKTIDTGKSKETGREIKPDNPSLSYIERCELAAETINAYASAWSESLNEVLKLDTSRPGFEILAKRVAMIRQNFTNAINLLKSSAMKKVCPTCNGEKCAACEQRGWYA